MSTILIKNGIILTFDKNDRVINNGFVYLEDGKIKALGSMKDLKSKKLKRPKKTIDASGRIVMPGIINPHMHFYSTFARGMGLPGFNPNKFSDILKGLWWKLDKKLTLEDVYYSTLVILLDAVKQGVTSIIDHHASPGSISGSLDKIEKAFDKVGLRSILCYEVSDRDGAKIRDEGLEENIRYLKKVKKNKDPMHSALFGLHASFTIKDKTFEKAVELGSEVDAGFHIHCAEGIEDFQLAKKRGYKGVVHLLNHFNILNPKTILAHCIHISGKELNIIKRTGAIAVHNPSSNMNNAVGVMNLLQFVKKDVLVGIGTDGMWIDPIREYVNSFLLQRINLRKPNIAFMETFRAFMNNAGIYSRISRIKTGQIKNNWVGDVIIKDYTPPTPISKDNVIGHFLFGISNSQTLTTICNGKILMENGLLNLNLNTKAIYKKSNELAEKLWKRI